MLCLRLNKLNEMNLIIYSPFCVPAKVTKLIGLKRPPFLSPTNLIIFACTQNSDIKVKF
jgi:hypothetical protein